MQLSMYSFTNGFLLEYQMLSHVLKVTDLHSPSAEMQRLGVFEGFFPICIHSLKQGRKKKLSFSICFFLCYKLLEQQLLM